MSSCITCGVVLESMSQPGYCTICQEYEDRIAELEVKPMNKLIKELRELAEKYEYKVPGTRTGSLTAGERMSFELTALIDKYDHPEYIEDDEITDDMLQGRRIPCEVRDFTGEKWVPQILVIVDTDYPRFVTKNGEPWKYCRIKKTDLPEASE